jgi:hypothetical protein
MQTRLPAVGTMPETDKGYARCIASTKETAVCKTRSEKFGHFGIRSPKRDRFLTLDIFRVAL